MTEGQAMLSQPLGAIMQVAYVVADLEQAIENFRSVFGMGPWFVVENFTAPIMRYRGQDTDLAVRVGFSFSGSMMYELIEINDTPSALREVVEERGYGLHHFGVMTKDFDSEIARLTGMGFEVVFEAQNGPEMNSTRVSYVDTRKAIGAMYELGEYCEPVVQFFNSMQAASADWDGKDPIRPVSFG